MKRITSLLLACFLFLCVLTACTPGQKRHDWNSIKLSHILPEPQSNHMEIFYTDEDSFYVQVCQMSLSQYSQYLQWCAED